MKNLLLILIGILLYSCGPSKEEIDSAKQQYIHTVTLPYTVELISGITYTKNICTRVNASGEAYLNIDYCGTLTNFWDNIIAKDIKSCTRIATTDSNNVELNQHMLSIDGIVVDLPEEWMEISRDKYVKESLKGYISGDTLYIEFNH